MSTTAGTHNRWHLTVTHGEANYTRGLFWWRLQLQPWYGRSSLVVWLLFERSAAEQKPNRPQPEVVFSSLLKLIFLTLHRQRWRRRRRRWFPCGFVASNSSSYRLVELTYVRWTELIHYSKAASDVVTAAAAGSHLWRSAAITTTTGRKGELLLTSHIFPHRIPPVWVTRFFNLEQLVDAV